MLKNTANWYIALLCLDTILPIYIDSPINSVIFWLIIFISIYFAFRVTFSYSKDVYFKRLNVLLFLFFVYGLCYYLWGPNYIEPASGLPLNKLSYITMIFKSLLPVYSFYFFSKKGFLTPQLIVRWIPVFFIIGGVVFNSEMQRALTRHFMSDDVTNNAGYYMVSMLPLFLFYKKNIVFQYVGMLLVAILVIFSMKRGAILLLSLMLSYFIYKTIKDSKSKMRLWFILFAMVIICAIYFFVVNYMMNNLYFMSRIEDTLAGDSSSRDDLYSVFIKHILNADLLPLLFGSGANYTLHLSYNYAHNDWLEIGVNQGLIGVLIFIRYWYAMFKKYNRTSVKSVYHVMFGMVFICLFIKTLFSMSYSDTTFYTNICLGYCLAKDNI